jgi:NhaP-type Na+/H+ or K+/H+ antiporter
VLEILLVATGALGMVVAALSGRIRQLPLSEPLLGLVVGIVLGPAVTDVLSLPTVIEDPGVYQTASLVLLAISVMALALRYPFHQARRLAWPVVLLVVVAMPGMAALATGVSWAVLGLAPAAALLLGTALCPTDPVLAASVVTGAPAERDIALRSRQLLSLESGWHDALAAPLVLLDLLAAGALSGATAAVEIGWELGGGVLIGAVLGWLGGRALRSGEEHGAAEHGPALFFTLLLAVGVLGAAELLGTNGILAVLVAGFAFNLVSTGGERGGAVEVDEGINRFVILPLFVVIGAGMPWSEIADLGWRGPVLVVAVLLLRRLPVLALLRRPLRLGWPDALFLGWFGPIGVSAVFYLTLQAERMGVDPTVLAAGMLVVAGSTVAHGLTVTAGRQLYRRQVTRRGAGAAP